MYPSLGRAAHHSLRQDVERAGLTSVGFSLGIRRLMSKGFIEEYSFETQDGYVAAASITDAGWNWIDKNEDKFRVRREPKKKAKSGDDNPFNDDIPF